MTTAPVTLIIDNPTIDIIHRQTKEWK